MEISAALATLVRSQGTSNKLKKAAEKVRERRKCELGVEKYAPKNQLEAAFLAVGQGIQGDGAEQIVAVLLDMINREEEGKRARKIVKCVAVAWPEFLAKELSKVVRAEKKSAVSKMEALEAIHGLVGDLSRSEEERKSIKDMDKSSMARHTIKYVGDYLVQFADQHSKRSGANRFPQPTKIALKAGDLFIELFTFACKKAQTDAMRKELDSVWLVEVWRLRGHCADYVELLETWNKSANVRESEPFLVGLKDFKSTLALFKRLERYSAGAALALCAHTLSTSGTLTSFGVANELEDSVVGELKLSIKELDSTPLGKELGTSDEDELRKEQLEEMARVQLRRLCLIVGRILLNDREIVLSSVADELLASVAKQFSRSMASSNELSLRLFGHCLSLVIASNESRDGNEDRKVLSAYSPMLEMLKGKDIASDCAIQVYAHGMLKFPGSLIPEILGLLVGWQRTESEAAVLNALTVVKEYTALFLQSPPRTLKGSPFGEKLVDRVVELFQSKTFKIRNPAGETLASFDPEFVVPYLCAEISTRTIQSSPESRSVVSIALSKVFELQQDTVKVFRLYLDYLLGVEEPSKDLLDASNRWAAGIPDHVWPSIVVSLTMVMLEKPNNPSVVGLTRRLSEPYLNNFAHEAVQSTILPRMESQRELTEADLSEHCEASEVQSILFDRLSPLLFLRMLSPRFYGKQQSDELLVRLLLHRVLGVYEFKEIRQMSIEILARLPHQQYTWPIFTALLRSFLEGETLKLKEMPASVQSAVEELALHPTNEPIYPSDVRTAKAAVYGMCHAISLSPGGGVPKMSFECLIATLRLTPMETSEELLQLQQGATQCLSILVAGRVDEWAKEFDRKEALLNAPKIVEMDPSAKDNDLCRPEDNADHILPGPNSLHVVLGALFDSTETTSARICAANSVILSLRMLAQEGGIIQSSEGGEKNPDASKKPVDAIRGLASLDLVDSVVHFVQHRLSAETSCSHPERMRIVACCFQLLFTVILIRTKVLDNGSGEWIANVLSVSLVERITSLTLAGLDEKDPVVRSSSMKLVGVLLTLPSTTPLPDGVFGQYLKSLRSISNLDADPECRKLAENLIRSCEA